MKQAVSTEQNKMGTVPVRRLLLGMVRLIIVALPLAWGLTRLDNTSELVWIAFPAAEACALLLGLLMMRRIRRQVLDTL